MATEAPVRPDREAAEQLTVAPEGGVVDRKLVDAVRVVEPMPLGLRAGGAGGADKFVDNGGTVLQVTQLFLIYWGTAWTATPAPIPTSAQITAACQTMTVGPYMAGLAQYRGIGRGFVRGSTVITSSNPPNNFTDVQVSNFIDAQITAGTVPATDVDNQTLYCVMMPTGVNASNSNFIGEHTYYIRSGQRIHFAWITNSGSLSRITTIISHELVESATDPEGSAFLGVAGTCSQGGWCEIGDVCSATSTLDGVSVQSYWSNQAGQCLVPGWPTRSYPRVGVQWTGTVAARSSQRWFTFNWPEWERVEWRMLPIAPRPGAPQLHWKVAIERPSGNYLTYWITVTNLTDQSVDFEGRYCVLGRT
ncbi:hypothetical protein [Kitasatospora sp. NPDC097691]|uniref:hypothetical protein n=1 Tax=Kitasatospora sp. NPDC097691 TaxID=3157231 RepID=UPI003332E519